MKSTKQAKGGKAKTPAKKAAARANGRLGGRPRKADIAKAPHLFVGTFGYNINISPEAQRESEDVRFTALIETTDINSAVRGFRRLLRHPRVQDAIKGNAVELISCCEIEAMPAEGIVTFIEFLYRDPEERDYHSAIQGVGITVPDGHRGVNTYGYKGAFLKGKNFLPVTNVDEGSSDASDQRH
jgi:hypothetical protein